MQQLAQWHETKTGLLVFAAIELALAYGLASLAINSGSIWQWLLAILLLIGAAQNGLRLFSKVFRKAHRG